jgi:hypothetical protein
MPASGQLRAVEIADRISWVTTKPFPLVAYAPLGVTALLVVWTILVSPRSKYGDSWAIDPALVALPLVVGLHVRVAYQARWRSAFIAYALLHCAVFFVIWIYCLTHIIREACDFHGHRPIIETTRRDVDTRRRFLCL